MFWLSYFTALSVGPALDTGFIEMWFAIVSLGGLLCTGVAVVILMVWAYNDNLF